MLISGAGLGVSEAVAVLTGPRQRILITQTLFLGVAAASCALAIGLPIGVALGRCDSRRVAVPRFIMLVPLALPSYVPALAWVLIADTRLDGSWTYSLSATAVVQAFVFYPIVMLAAEAATRSVPQSSEEAARLVASPWRVWVMIMLPLIAPPLAAALLVVFVLSISDFAVPSMLRVRVFTSEVFTAFSAFYDFGLATVMALPLALVGAVAALGALAMARRPSAGRVERGRAGIRWSPRVQELTAVVLWAVALSAVAIPIGTVALEARSARVAVLDSVSLDAMRNGFVWSSAGATAVLMIAAVLGYWRANAGRRAGHIMEVIWIMLFAMPGTIAGIGVVGVWNRAGIMGDIYRTPASVVIAYVSRFLPIAAVLCAGFFRRVPSAVEEAAVVGGASWRRAFARVVLPLVAKGLAAVWLVMFILMFGDVSLAILVAPPGESNLAVRAYTLMANSPVPDVAGIALMQVVLSIVPLAALVSVLNGMDDR